MGFDESNDGDKEEELTPLAPEPEDEDETEVAAAVLEVDVCTRHVAVGS